MATKEIVHNAVKYSNAKNIFINASFNNEILEFVIEADGCGFDTLATCSGNGMKNIKQRIKDLGGEINIESTKSKSTLFSFSIPLLLNVPVAPHKSLL